MSKEIIIAKLDNGRTIAGTEDSLIRRLSCTGAHTVIAARLNTKQGERIWDSARKGGAR